MVMMVQELQRIEDEALPVAGLAAALRLPDGYDAVLGQVERLRSRLRAAIATVEDRTGRILVSREVKLQGIATGGVRQVLPVTPVSEILEAWVQKGLAVVPLGHATVEPRPHRPVAIFERAIRPGATLQMTVMAGYDAWTDVPAPLQEATLTIAQGLDIGQDVREEAAMLLAPYRSVRIGGGAA